MKYVVLPQVSTTSHLYFFTLKFALLMVYLR